MSNSPRCGRSGSPRRVALASAAAAAVLCLPGVAAGLSADKALVTFNAKKGDGFVLKGRLGEFSLEGTDAVALVFGTFSETVPIGSFQTRGQKRVFKAPKGTRGLKTLVVDTAKQRFFAAAKGVSLSPFQSPAAVRLATAASDDCGMIRFAEQAKRWSLAGAAGGGACVLETAPEVSPSGFFVSTATPVRALLRLAAETAPDGGSATLRRVDGNLTPVGDPVCALRDDGDAGNGDEIAADGVYSCLSTFNEPEPVRIRLVAEATIGGTPALSPSVFLDVARLVTDEEINTVIGVQETAGTMWEDNLAALGDTKRARKATAAEIAQLPGVASAGLSGDGLSIWIRYASGVEGGLNLDPPGTPGSGPVVEPAPEALVGSPARGAALAAARGLGSRWAVAARAVSTEPPRVGNNKVLLWSPFADEGSAGLDQIAERLRMSECPAFEVTDLRNEQCTVESVKTFAAYGTVLIATHGAVLPDGRVAFMTRQKASLFSEYVTYREDLSLGRLLVYNGQRRPEKKGYFVFRPSFIQNIPGRFPDSLIFAGACTSAQNPTMANIFLVKGAKAYYGLSTVAYASFSRFVLFDLLGSLVEQHRNAAEAHGALTYKDDASYGRANPVLGLKPLGTEVRLLGDGRLAYSGDFRNGGFESGDLGGWTATGDARVLTRLGEFSPREGQFTGILSTGLGFTTAAGSIEQSFCLPKDAKRVDLEWNFCSEEFVEWCGSSFDDTFQVELVTAAGGNVLLTESVNGLCGGVSGTSLAFDQSGPACEPTDGVGPGTGGNDCKVWGTGWRAASLDVAAVATANDGKSVTLRLSASDRGDSAYDSAVLVDNIRIAR
jgi:hypothetical protein